MKRIVLTVASSSLLVLAAPGIAAAANHKHARHHARHASAHVRHVHAKHASIVMLGKLAPASAPAGTPVVLTPPSTPTLTPTPFTPEQVAVVVSFEKETLTLELSDKSTYAGEVTEGTEIQCRPEGKSDTGSEEGSEHHGEDGEKSEEKKLTKGEGAEEDEGCGQEALVKGAKIYGAELSLTSFGGIWEKIGVLQ